MIKQIFRSLLMISMALALGVIIAQAQEGWQVKDGSSVGAPDFQPGSVPDPRPDINFNNESSTTPSSVEGTVNVLGVQPTCIEGNCPEFTGGSSTPLVYKEGAGAYKPNASSSSSSGSSSRKTTVPSSGSGGGTDGGRN